MKFISRYKKFIMTFIIGGILFSSIGAYAALIIGANEVAVTSSKTTKTTVQDSLDELYDLMDTRYTAGYNAGIAEGSAKAFNPAYIAERAETNTWGQVVNKTFVTPSAGKIRYTIIGNGNGTTFLQFNRVNQVSSSGNNPKSGTLSVDAGVTVGFLVACPESSYQGYGFAVFYTE